MSSSASATIHSPLVIGVLAIQGAVSEHEDLLKSVDPSVSTRQVRLPSELAGLDALVLPGGESTAMGLIGTQDGMWDAIREFVGPKSLKPAWGTCAGMILLAERCVGASAVIVGGQALIGGVDVLVCRNYFGSQVASFEMPIPAPPGDNKPFPGVFIRAPAILAAGPGVAVLSKVVASPCRTAAAVLRDLDARLARGEDVRVEGVVEEKEASAGDGSATKKLKREAESAIVLPGASGETEAREVICAVKVGNILCTAFHPELTRDDRWHRYFVEEVVRKSNIA
jgi:5'-phosphate synthase pdxT subunit